MEIMDGRLIWTRSTEDVFGLLGDDAIAREAEAIDDTPAFVRGQPDEREDLPSRSIGFDIAGFRAFIGWDWLLRLPAVSWLPDPVRLQAIVSGAAPS